MRPTCGSEYTTLLNKAAFLPEAQRNRWLKSSAGLGRDERGVQKVEQSDAPKWNLLHAHRQSLPCIFRPRARFNHAVWHVFVPAGSICHYVAVARYVLPEGSL